MTKNHPAPAQIHVLLLHGAPIAAQLVPFKLPEYGDKVSLSQVVYVPAAQHDMPQFMYDMNKWLSRVKFANPEDEITCAIFGNQFTALLNSIHETETKNADSRTSVDRQTTSC